MMTRFPSSLTQVIQSFPGQTPQEVMQRWAFIKRSGSRSCAEVQQTIPVEETSPPEPMTGEVEPPEWKITPFEETSTFEFEENWRLE